jgi:hypothetical protein
MRCVCRQPEPAEFKILIIPSSSDYHTAESHIKPESTGSTSFVPSYVEETGIPLKRAPSLSVPNIFGTPGLPDGTEDIKEPLGSGEPPLPADIYPSRISGLVHVEYAVPAAPVTAPEMEPTPTEIEEDHVESTTNPASKKAMESGSGKKTLLSKFKETIATHRK